MPAEKTMTIRLSEEELERWKEAAWIRKVTLSEWVRAVLNATAASMTPRA